MFADGISHAGVQHVEQRELEALAEGGKRGDAMPRARHWLEAAMASRGLSVHYLDMGWDAYLPILAAPEVLKRWQSALFGKRRPVLP